MSKQWSEIILPVPSARIDAVCSQLTENGVAGLVVEEEGDFLRFLEENRQYWNYVDEDLRERMRGVSQVKFYVPDNPEGQRLLHKYLQGLEQIEYRTVTLREEDWATCWQRYYQPIPVGKRLYIVPDWMRDQPVPAGRVPLYLNPGLTFGTGAHATTQLCLELLEDVVHPGDRALDLGCGSGILAIAACKLGAARAIGVDVDPKAVGVAYENAALDGVGRDRLTVLAGDVLSDKKLLQKLAPGENDLLLANIVADVIIPLTGVVRELLTSGGTFLTSGILEERADEVQRAIEQAGLTIEKKTGKNGWTAFQARA